MAELLPPSPLVVEKNLSEVWKKWERAFRRYMGITELKKKDKSVQVGTLHNIGEDANDIYLHGLKQVMIEKTKKMLKPY